jgi:ariadne-1
VRYDCHTCANSKDEKDFPDYNPSTNCKHLINTCIACLQRYIDTQIESANVTIGGDDNETFGIQRSEYPAIMRAVNVEIATSEKMSAQLKRLERVLIGNNTPG